MWYMGETFNKKENKQYKTLEGGLKQAQAKNLNLYDEDGEVVHAAKPSAVMTDQVPEGADRSGETDKVGVFNEAGEQVGEISSEEAEAAAQELIETVDGHEAVRVSGKIRRIFNGQLRIRRRPSWLPDAVCGVSLFEEKKITHLLEVDGRQMYRTTDGYYITADPDLVEYVEG